MRLVLIKNREYVVYADRKMLATYTIEENSPTPTKEEVEWIRIQEYKA